MKTFKIFFFSILGIIVFAIVCHVYIIVSAKDIGQKIYQIEVKNYRDTESYLTYKYTVDSSGCIHFKDMIGLGHTVCNNKYSITEF